MCDLPGQRAARGLSVHQGLSAHVLRYGFRDPRMHITVIRIFQLALPSYPCRLVQRLQLDAF